MLTDKNGEKVEQGGKECLKKKKRGRITLLMYFAFYFYGNRLANRVVAKGNGCILKQRWEYFWNHPSIVARPDQCKLELERESA